MGSRDAVLPLGRADRPAAARLLEATGWARPEPSAYPTGDDWIQSYLAPLAAALGDRVRLGARVVGVARRGCDRVVDAGRDTEPLTVHVRTDRGEERIEADALVDASGTWGSPNPLGADGLPAVGERDAGDRIVRQTPDLLDPVVRARYAGRRVAVAGAGHSALTAIVALSRLADEEPGSEVVWLLRRGTAVGVFGGGEADQLPARGALGKRAKEAVRLGRVEVRTGFRVSAVRSSTASGRLELLPDGGGEPVEADEVLALTGFRPDLSWLSELRIELDPTLPAPSALAPLIDPNVHSCGTVYPHGAAELSHPEPGVFLVGMKSYGRAPTFLALTGYEQVRSVAAAIAGDHEAAARVDLTLPETGVCGGSGGFGDTSDDAGCCAPAEPVLLTVSSFGTGP